MHKLLFTILILSSSLSWAARPWEVDAGADVLQHGLGRGSKDETGAKSLLGTSYLNIDLQVHAQIGSGLFLSPRVMFMPSFLLPHKSGSVKSTYTIVGLPVLFDLSPSFDAWVGPAYMIYNLSGPGGTTQLSNGNGTSTFAQPGGSVSAKTFALMLGSAYKVKDIRLSLDLFTEGLFSSSKRTFSLMAGVTYAIF